MTKLNIYMVRHGQTYYNIYNKLQGWSNSPLTQKGIDDAKKAGERLAKLHFDAAYCSDTTRAMETAQMILDANQSASVAQPIVKMNFREEFYGYYEGNNMDETWYVAGAPHGLKTFKDIVNKYSIAKAKDFLKEADPFHDAENDAEYWQRLEKGFDLIRSNPQLKDNDNVLLVSHGNTVLSMMEKYGEGKYDLTVRPANGSVTKLVLTSDNIEVEYYNQTD
jgi:probable phosphoglycerate mutase